MTALHPSPVIDAVVLISANAEWQTTYDFFPHTIRQKSPFGEWFELMQGNNRVVFLHGGWGKISAAASTQYALDRWQPRLLINLCTCGGFAGYIERGEILLVDRTLVYDIIEQMNPEPEQAIRFYSVDLDLSWLQEPYPQPVRRGLLVSADRDICSPDIPLLIEQYSAAAADWESGAIAWVASRHGLFPQGVRCLILRGVSDLVSLEGGEAYNGLEYFQTGARQVMETLLAALPAWLDCCG